MHYGRASGCVRCEIAGQILKIAANHDYVGITVRDLILKFTQRQSVVQWCDNTACVQCGEEAFQ